MKKKVRKPKHVGVSRPLKRLPDLNKEDRYHLTKEQLEVASAIKGMPGLLDRQKLCKKKGYDYPSVDRFVTNWRAYDDIFGGRPKAPTKYVVTNYGPLPKGRRPLCKRLLAIEEMAFAV